MLINFRSIREKILVMLISGIIIIILIMSTFFTIFYGQAFEKRIINDQELIMRHIKKNVETVIESINLSTWYLYRDREMANLANDSEGDDFVQYTNRDRFDEVFKFYLVSPNNTKNYTPMFFIYPEVYLSQYLTSHKIENKASLNKYVFRTFSSQQVINEKWFKDTENLEGRINVFLSPEDKETVYISRLIKNPYVSNAKKSEYLGIVVIAIDIQQLQKEIELSMLTKNSDIFLVNSDDLVVFSNDRAVIGESTAVFPTTDIFESGNQMNKMMIAGENHYVRSFSLDWGLRLVSTIPSSDVTREFVGIRKNGMLISAICLLIAAIISILLSRSISSPIVSLSRTMKSITEKEDIKENINMTVEYKDEVGMLYESFRSMITRIQGLISESYENARKQKKLELKALQAQINPHFVYNTLDSINWVALCNGEKEIVKMVSALASIMRYSISNPEGIVTVREELTHVQNYVGIQKIRFNNSFDLSIDANEEVYTYKMPKFIIQPIVENAIVHGIQNMEGRGIINIKIEYLEDLLNIIVSDNGAGANAEEINVYLKGNKTSIRDSDGFGIANVNQRIKLFCGEQYGLKYISNISGGISVQITLKQN